MRNSVKFSLQFQQYLHTDTQTRTESVYYATNILIITYEFFHPLGNENMRRVLIYAN